MTSFSTDIKGVTVFEFSNFKDERGFSSVANFPSEITMGFELDRLIVVNNPEIGTLRGLHGQLGDSAESKVVFGISGVFFDVFLDLRTNSQSFGKWGCRTITSNREGLILPKGIWHGYQTLDPNTSVGYLVNGNYVPSRNISVNPFDNDLQINWPIPVTRISDADKYGLSFHNFLSKFYQDGSI